MGKARVSTTTEDPTIFGLDPNDTVTAQEATSVPLFAGEALLTLQWISAPYDQFTREVDAAIPGKK